MAFIAPEVITEAKRMDLLTYLQAYEPHELVHFSGDAYTTKTHDSLKISNGKWMWWSRGIGGKTALDYLVKVKGKTFVQAVETIMGSASVLPVPLPPPTQSQPKRLLLPKKSPTTDIVTDYLFGRGIDYEIINCCIQNGILFESLPYHNAVFVGRDSQKIPRYAAYRATDHSSLKGDASGSDKHYSFRLDGTDKSEVHLFECAIDALSYASLQKLKGHDWREKTILSLAGVYAPKKEFGDNKVPAAVEEYLKNRPETQRIILHFDNDMAGRKATYALLHKLSDRYEVVDDPPAMGKDYNDFLCSRLGISKKKERSFER